MRALALIFMAGCTSMLPMTHDANQVIPDSQVARIAAVTRLTPAQVRDPAIHEVHEVKMPCGEMLRQCYSGVPLYSKLLGSLPTACTAIIQQPWNEKVALIYHCWATDPLTMAHEREHAKGRMHKWW